jgi:Xaa-Pro aminopeptidase
MLSDRIPQIQQALTELELDGWLFFVFQGNDPISLEFLGLCGRPLVTRRAYYLVPRQGNPRKLCSRLESGMLDHLPGERQLYATWQEHRARLEELVRDCRRLAAQYSPKAELPSSSRLDAGTAELLRSFGVELHSSAELISRFLAVWTPEQLAGHRRAAQALTEIVHAALSHARDRLKNGSPPNEYELQQWILGAMDRAGLSTEAPPIVAVDGHAADPHFEPSPETAVTLSPGQWLLIDLWAKERQPDSVYADITWCAVVGPSPTERQMALWRLVAQARDRGIEFVRSRYPHTPIRGFEVDDVVRRVIEEGGYGPSFFHRTGHSIGIQDHGPGANLDNLETHDTRRLLPMTGFSIEPGIYLPGEIGIRSEVNMALTETEAEVTTGPPQEVPICLIS